MSGQRKSPNVVYVGDVLLNVFPVPVRVVSVHPFYFRSVFA